MGGFAWVTLATNDSYSLGALVLAHSLKQVGTNQKLVVMITPGVTKAMRDKLSTIFDLIQEVNILDSKDETNLRLLKRPELGITFTKLHCWRLTQFEKCVFLDADTLVLENCDELFEREELSAAPDVGWPDCFNSGVFVYRPSNETYEKLVQFALEKGSFDGGDQGLLNMYFSDWAHKDISKHLPFIYNLCSTACYSYLPAFKQFGGKAKIIHFIGTTKPWLQYFNTETKTVQPSENLKHLQSVLQHWWNIFCDLVHSNLSTEMTRSRSDVVHNNPNSNNHPTTNPSNISYKSVDHYYNVWDPWEEYDNKKLEPSTNEFQKQSEIIETKPIESHNTNAYYSIDNNFINENNPEPSIQYSSEVNTQYYPESSIENHSKSNYECNSRQISEQNNTEIINTEINSIQIVNNNSNNLILNELSNLESKVPNLDINLNKTEPLSYNPVLTNECEVTINVPNEITLHKPTNNEDQINTGIAGAFAQLTLGAPRTSEQTALDDLLRRQGWEVGNIDYLGRDSFDNIWIKICETLSTTKAPSPPPQQQQSPSTVTTIIPKPKESTPQLKEPTTSQTEPTSAKISSAEAVQPEKETEKTVQPPKPDPVVAQSQILECSLPVTATQKIPEEVSKTDKPTGSQNVVTEDIKTTETKIIQKPIETATVKSEQPVKVSEEHKPEITKSDVPSAKSKTDSPLPPIECQKPAPDSPKPVPESLKSVAVCPKPTPECPKSEAVCPKPDVQGSKSKPVTECPKPAPESPKPIPDSPKSVSECSKPAPESLKSVSETPKPIPQSQKSAPESPKTKPEGPKVAPIQTTKSVPTTKTPPKTPPATESVVPPIPKSTDSKKVVEVVSKKVDTTSDVKQATPPSSPVTTTPKKQATTAVAETTATEASTSSPTPPPRKGSSGTKKPAKPKK